MPPPRVVSARRTTRSPRAATTGREPELRRSLTDARDDAGDSCGAVMHGDASSALDRDELLELDIEPVGDGKGAGRRRARRRGAARDARPRAGRARPARPRWRWSTALSCTCTDAHPNFAPARLRPERVARGDRSGPERARDDRADAAQREDAIDVEARRPAGLACRNRVRGAGESRPQRVEPGPVLALTQRPRRPGTSSRASSSASSRVSASTGSDFVTATTPCSTPRSRRIARCSWVWAGRPRLRR